MSERTDMDTAAALEALQSLDDRIDETQERLRAFDPQLADVEEPALALESEVGTTRARLKEMKMDERRLELASEEKRTRIKKLEERLKGVRNVREESAVSAELDMVRQALEAEDQEALTLLDQIRKLELRLDEQEEALGEARAEVEPRREALLEQRDEVKEEIAELETRRAGLTGGMGSRALRVYERIRADNNRRAVSRLTPDGACGNCFNVLPLQLQNEVRHGGDMIRCEACGVILTSAEKAGSDEEDGQA
ncbi:MAG: C4-type zinc ribbon domain-containing protein [Gemmatimonadota bacterium]